METPITVNNPPLNQTIELKAPQKVSLEDGDANNGDNSLDVNKKTPLIENEKAVLFNLDAGQISTSNVNSKKAEKDTLELEEAIEVVADFMKLSTQSVNFQKDETTDITVIKVFDTESKDLIKQFPSEEVINIAHKILELRQDIGLKTGILLDEHV
jgi:flagellar protein FlaG